MFLPFEASVLVLDLFSKELIQILQRITNGETLAKPPYCPKELYELMLQCWSINPEQRPRFVALKDLIKEVSVTFLMKFVTFLKKELTIPHRLLYVSYERSTSGFRQLRMVLYGKFRFEILENINVIM